MTQILIAGVTGYAGSALAREAVDRGHGVLGVSRSAPETPLDGVTHVQGAAPDAVVEHLDGRDVVVAALSPRGDMAGRLVETYAAIARAAADAGVRLIVVGGYSSLRPRAGADRFIAHAEESPYLAEAQEMNAVLEWLESDAPAGLDWLFVSPGLGFSAWNPGERTGAYRVGDDVSLTGEEPSDLSGADLAIALLDEIESSARRGHVGIAS